MRIIARFYLLLGLCLTLMTGCGDESAPAKATVVINHGSKPLTIGVVTADAAGIWPALTLANQLSPTAAGRPVQLKLKSGADLIANARSLSRTENLAALIVAGNPRRSADFAALNLPVYFSAALNCGKQPGLRSASASAGELARLAASFTLKTFKPAKVAVVLDQASEASVRGASQYAAALNGQGGRVASIVYLDGPRSALDGLVDKFESQGVQAIGLPYSGELTTRLIAELRDQGCRIPIIVINPPDELAFGTRWRHRREQLYVLSQFSAEQAGGGRAQTLVKALTKDEQTLNSAQALAVDSYLLAIDGLSGLPALANDYLAGRLSFADAACPQRNCYVYRVKGRKLELIETLKAR